MSFDEQLARIKQLLPSKGVKLDPVASEAFVKGFEQRHGIELPAEYRAFITRLGNGGTGHPYYGLQPLGAPSTKTMTEHEKQVWIKLPYVRIPFPFTKPWIWEDDEISDEGDRAQVEHGSIYLGTDGCAENWHLIILGKERGQIWSFTGEGIQPLCPSRNFLDWYEDWLNNLEPWRDYK